MGEYNPHLPQILGQEWVPIREEDFTLSPSVNAVEVGHGFTLAAPRLLQSLRYYEKDPSPNANSQVFLASIYAKGTEGLSGPIRSILIPVNNGGVTGTGISVSTGAQVANALLAPDDNSLITFSDVGPLTQEIAMFFATNNSNYSAALTGKRILGVNFKYAFIIDPRAIADQSNLNSALFIGTDTNDLAVNLGNLSDDMGTYDPSSGNVNFVIGTKRLGEINQMWDTTSLNVPNTTGERLPWNYTALQRFEASASQRLHMHLVVQLNNPDAVPDPAPFAYFSYAALEVFFCDEQRLVIGSFQRPNSAALSLTAPGTFTMTARSNNTTYTVNPVLTAGDYVITLSSPDTGSLYTPPTSFPKLNALREYYAIPPHPGVQVNIPAPIDATKLGETFTVEQTHILPQLSIHTSGGPLTEVHVYGRQATAHVYGTIIASQEILDTIGGQTWPQVRYYARRFGDTTVPLLLFSPDITGAGASVALTPAEWDELPEIIDGWKEITKEFSTPPTMGSGQTRWRWSAAGETPGSRWEVLGATAPALSGQPGNLLVKVPAPHQLSLATYGAPTLGDTTNLGWVPGYSPIVTSVTDDQTADAVLMFAQNMLPVTGFSVTMLSQPVSGIGPDCGVDPCCIPSEIFYNSLTWSQPVNTGTGTDGFARDVAAGSWGNADVGGAYTLSGTSTDFAVGTSNVPWDTEDSGVITFSANSSNRFATLNLGAINFDITAEIQFLSTVATGLLRGGIVGRYTDASNTYIASLDISSTGAVTIQLSKIVAGVTTSLASATLPNLSGGIGSALMLRFVGYGTYLKTKAWAPIDEEPDTWTLQVNDSDLTTGGRAGVFGRDESAVTGHIIAFDSLSISPPQYWFGYYELQRMDELSDWATIMQATDPTVVSFKDYEPRIGIRSDYRIRAVDMYNFPGPWSSTVSETVDEPGVEIGCEGGHLLVFTTNSDQDGNANLAYSSVWEGTVNEDFDFPEAGDVILQKMYGKNFVTAFRPLERGGERFTRTVLVQAAAISAPTLGDFTALRDMAWEQFPYICVRDEDGNRWFATVLVPSGRVQLNRTLYMAPVTVMEVTDTPFPVDP